MDGRRMLPVSYLLAAMLIALAVQTWFARPQEIRIDYSDFKTLVRAGQIEEAKVAERSISGTIDPAAARAEMPEAVRKPLPGDAGSAPIAFTTARMEDPGLLVDLENAHTRYSGVDDHGWLTLLLSWVVRALIFVAIWTFVLGRVGGRGAGDLVGIGKSKAKVFVQKNIGVRFSDVEGIDEAKAELRRPLSHYSQATTTRHAALAPQAASTTIPAAASDRTGAACGSTGCSLATTRSRASRSAATIARCASSSP